jgi:hypothetical protein
MSKEDDAIVGPSGTVPEPQRVMGVSPDIDSRTVQPTTAVGKAAYRSLRAFPSVRHCIFCKRALMDLHSLA